MRRVKSPTVVDEVTDTLAYRIAAGIYATGDLLPSVRHLATEFGISTPTANSALGRLSALGFAEARRGLGYTVRDIRLYGGIDIWRHIFRNSRQLPQSVAQIFTDLLEVERLLNTEVLRRIAAEPHRYDLTMFVAELDQLDQLTCAAPVDAVEFLRAEMQIVRTLIVAVGQFAYLGIYNSICDILLESTDAAASFIAPAEPAVHVAVWRQLQEVWRAGEPVAMDQMIFSESLIVEYHKAVAEDFHLRIVGSSTLRS